MFAIYSKHVYDIYVYTNTSVCYLQKAASWGIYVNWINFYPSMDK